MKQVLTTFLDDSDATETGTFTFYMDGTFRYSDWDQEKMSFWTLEINERGTYTLWWRHQDTTRWSSEVHTAVPQQQIELALAVRELIGDAA